MPLYTIEMIKHDIIFRNGEDQYRLVQHFKGVCESCTFPSVAKFKEPNVESWYDEDGSDAYIGGRICADSGDLEIGIGFPGRRNTSLDTPMDMLSDNSPTQLKFDYLIRFLTTGSEESGKARLSPEGISIFSVRDNRGLAGCYLKEVRDMEYYVENSSQEYEIMTFTLVFGVMDPTNSVILSY